MGRGTNRFAATITRLSAIAVAALTASTIASLSTPGAARAAVPDAYCAGPTDNVAGGRRSQEVQEKEVEHGAQCLQEEGKEASGLTRLANRRPSSGRTPR
jgi:hypothetical protein